MKKLITPKIYPVLIAVVVALLALPPGIRTADAAEIGVNLIKNADLQAGQPNAPDNWHIAGYSDISTSTYPVQGPGGAGDKAVQITILTHIAGDAKWVFDNVDAEEGALYTFSDSYKSDVPTTVVAAYTKASSTDPSLFTNIVSLTSSDGQWKTVTKTFTVPFGYTKVSVYHVIAATGTLTTDNYELSLKAHAADNVFPEGIVSLTLDDGWSTSFDTVLPILHDANNMKATFYIISKAMQEADDATRDNLLATSTHPDVIRTDGIGETQWRNVYTDPANKIYRLTETYQSAQPSTIQVGYTFGGATSTIMAGTLPAAPDSPRTASLVITLPSLDPGTPITLWQQVPSGNLSLSGPVTLTGYFPYMNSSQVLMSQAAGIEIGDHTVSHCNLVTRLCPDSETPTLPDPLTPFEEIKNAYDVLTEAKLSVNTLAYPYGAFNGDIQQLVKDAGLKAARSVDAGFNTKYSDKLGLSVQIVDSVTPLDKVKEWIDTALANKQWLILVFHQVEDQDIINARGDIDAVTPTTFQGIINYLKDNNADVRTLDEAAALMDVHVPDPKVTPDISLLTQAIESAQAKYDAAIEGTAPGNYATGSKAILLAAINAAKAITVDNTQAEIDAALATLNAAITTFEAAKIGPSDIAALATLITSAQAKYDAAVEGTVPGNYATGSKAILLAAINAAKAITVNNAQSEVDAARVTLNAAITTFEAAKVGPSDIAALVTLITSAQAKYDAAVEGTAPGNYATGSKAILLAAINAAKAITVNNAQSEVDAARVTLNAAITTFEAAKIGLRLSGEKGAYATTNSASITWVTSHAATSRVVWDTVSHPTAASLQAGQPNYGYPNSTVENANLTMNHSIVVTGLTPNTTYYFRSVSHGSPEVIGEEVSLKTADMVYGGYSAPAAPVVKKPTVEVQTKVEVAVVKPLIVSNTYIETEADSVYNFKGSLQLGAGQKKIFEALIATGSLSDQDKSAVADFIQNGTDSTRKHGFGERAGVLYSYRRAYGHLPQSVGDWQDVIRIANGRWPKETDLDTEKASLAIFSYIYKRPADLANVHDAAAVTIISYGLRPPVRNLASERAAMRYFKIFYGYNPSAAKDWDIVRAIAYSGAKR